MTPTMPSGVRSLRSALEAHTDSISTSAQMALEGLTSHGGTDLQVRDVSRIYESALAAYKLVHEQLTVEYFETVQSGSEELQRIRHDLRNSLQNTLLRGQIITEERDILPESVTTEVDSILRHARACVEAVNLNRDQSPSDVVLHSVVTAPDSLTTVLDDASLTVAGAKILIADDNADSRETLGRFLEREGHTVAGAATGREALKCLDDDDFDLLLLDLVMPEMNGFEVLESLQQRGVLQHLPVILISGLDSEANAVRGIELGAEDFLSRPVDLKLLRARVSSAIEKLRLREKTLASYFTPQLARYLLRHPEELTEGRRAEVSILFCDIVGFSRVSERLGAEQSIRWVGDVLTSMSSCIMEEEGVLVDYTGDQVMAMWGAPSEQKDHADRACRCAIAMRGALPDLCSRWFEMVGEPTDVSIGVNSGEAFVGNIGTPQKFKFGALGNTVNLASRVQSATKYVRSRVLITAATRDRIAGDFPLRRIGKVRVNNIVEPVDLHEIGASASARDGKEGVAKLREDYEKALNCFEATDFRAASAILGNVILAFPDDGPSLLLMSRVVDEILRNDAEGFDAVWTLSGK